MFVEESEFEATAEIPAITPDAASAGQEIEPAEAVAEIAEPITEESAQGSKIEAIQELPADAPDAEELETVASIVEPQADPTLAESKAAPQDSRAWYVVHCYSGHENKVKHNLEQRIETMQLHEQIFQVVVPTEDEIEVRDGKRRTVERRVFPGYILVQMILNDDSWYAVRNTPGVTGFVGMGNRPTPLRPEEVQAILKRMEANAPKIKVTFKKDQKVRIIDGPFNEFIGIVDELNMERAKVRVLVSFFGRETPVELDFLQVEKT